MKIIKMEQSKIAEEIFKCVLQSNGNERFEPGKRIFIDGEKYVVQTSKERDFNKVPTLFDVILRKPIQLTHFNHDNVNFKEIVRIERISTLRIHMKGVDNSLIEMGFETPEICLKEFVLLQRIWREHNGSFKQGGIE